MSHVRIAALGPLEATVEGDPVALGPLKQRLLLAILVCHPGVEVSSEVLVDALWAGQPPASAASNLRSYVYGLRQVLGKDLISGSGRPGYRLHHDRLSTDIAEFDALCADAEGAVSRHDFALARDLLMRAVALRRDRAFTDVGHLPVIADEVRGLEERWLLAMQHRFDVELHLGRAAELVAELTTLTTHHPYRERFWEQLMLALYRAGRQSDALAAYRQARQALLGELGVEPGHALQTMQRRILAADATLLPAPPDQRGPAPRPAQLPGDVGGFAGRDRELRRLDAMLAARLRRPTAICAVSGPAGVGKTSLVVRWAHRVVDQFPDGQLYLNLRGFDPDGTRLSAEEALLELLEALSVASSRIPVGLAARAALYRSTLAGRRMLVVLDNARDENQLRPLLPGASGCLAVVTSRNQLTGLIATEGADSLVLDLLDQPAARELLAERIGTDRVLAEPAAVDEIIQRCAGLPLALAVVAARAVTNPGFRLDAVAQELIQVQAPLDAFGGPDPASDVRAVFSWSYQALSPDAARLFRVLGLHPGPHLATAAAASLAGAPLAAVRPLLAELTRAHLLTEIRPGRYTFHDLLRAYADELVSAVEPDPERAAAVHRMLDHYLYTAYRAGYLLRPHPATLTLRPGVTPEDLADRHDAAVWFAVEHPVLLAMIALAYRPVDPGSGTSGSVAVHQQLSEHRQAIGAYLRASETFRDSANRYYEATTLKNIGEAYRASSDDESAHRVWREALTAMEEIGHDDAEQVRAIIDSSPATDH